MTKLLLTCLSLGALLAAFCLPAQARLVVGVAPATPLSHAERTSLDHLSEQLGKTAGDDITLRPFEDGKVLADWLLRFMELDAALVEADFIGRFPAGSLQRLADLHPENRKPGQVFSLVVRRNLDSARADAIRKAFLALDSSAAGRELLDQLELAGVTAPGKALKKQVSKTAEPPDKAVAPPQQKTDTIAKTHPAEPQPTAAPAVALVPTPSVPTPPAPVQALPPTTISPAPASPAETLATVASKAADPVAAVVPGSAKPEEAKAKPSDTRKDPPQSAPAPAKTPPNQRLMLFVALLILAAILLKAFLFAARWRMKRQEKAVGKEAPATDLSPSEPSAANLKAAAPVSATPRAVQAAEQNDQDLVVEAGRLGPGKVPALLKRCADLPRPVVLRTWKGPCEKLVFFAGGKVCGALTQNTDETESAKRWKKLGSLLVREALITAEELDQGLELLDRQPGLRLGEALLKLGHIDLTRLRHALTRQTKVTLYSLILFPEGRYEVVAGDGQIPPEESVALEINALIREASTHQAEWTTIRHTLPKLSLALDFTPRGRDKVTNVNLSLQQEAILDLINGQRTISDLCSESVMMDYEVYRFLYMMVKAGVLGKKTS